MPELTLFEKGLGYLSPKLAMERVADREALKEFAGSGSVRARGQDATLFEQASPEGWKKQRDRIKAIWEGRAMEEKLCLVNGILERVTQYVCQNMEYHASTGDAKADKAYEEYFHEWCGRADITGRHRFGDLVKLGLRAAIRDGEYGFVERMVNGELRLQSITADRIGSPNDHMQDERNIGGIKIGKMGEVVGYEIYKRSLNSQYTKEGEVSPDKFIHLFFPTSVDQYHGVSKLAPALPHAKDLYELLGYEKIAVKFAASFAGFIKQSDPYNKHSSTQWDSSASSSSGGTTNTMAAVPGAMKRLGKDEDVAFAPGAQRPSGAFMALMDAIIREIAIGMNLPYGFVYNMAAFGGVTARLETMQAQRVFESYQRKLQDTVLDRVKNKVIMLGIAQKKIPATKNWRKGSWKFGAHITGDVGHQVQAEQALIQMGLKSRSKACVELGNDFEEVAEENNRELLVLKKISERDGIPMELLNSSMSGAAGGPTELIGNLERAAAGESDEPAPPPGLVGSQGAQGVKPLLDVLEQHGEGKIDRDSAINTLMQLYGMTYLRASKLLPAEQVAVGGAQDGVV
jgi:lambda family phage portal protein